jgi:U3 small nucleolar RNA-associated protein 14
MASPFVLLCLARFPSCNGLISRLKFGRELQKKMDKINSDSDETDSSESSSEDEDANAKPVATKGLMGMEFMKRGVERDKAQYQERKRQMRYEDDEARRKVASQIDTGHVSCRVSKLFVCFSFPILISLIC